jgi:hypothetical protein
MKVIALSAMVLSTVAIASLAIAEPIKDRDVLPTLSTARPVELSNAEMGQITAGTAINLTGIIIRLCPGCQPGGPSPIPVPCCKPIIPNQWGVLHRP